MTLFSVGRWHAIFAASLLAASLAQQVEALMPITYFNKPCPGAHGCGRCTWFTELQGEQALIPEGAILCQVCMVIQGLRGVVKPDSPRFVVVFSGCGVN